MKNEKTTQKKTLDVKALSRYISVPNVTAQRTTSDVIRSESTHPPKWPYSFASKDVHNSITKMVGIANVIAIKKHPSPTF